MLNTAIIGAGPYGLSVAAHFRRRGIPFRIFGRPMDSWLNHMPKGMMLKSDGFASNIYDPDQQFTLEKFCTERGIEYRESGLPVRLETFNAYGLAFRERMVPELEEKQVESVERTADGFEVRLEGGETVTAQNVVLAVGITHFNFVPERLAGLPEQYVTHSASHREVEPFRGRSVAVIGAGASALDLAGLLHEAGAKVQIISRSPELKFHSDPTGKPRTLWQTLRHPGSGLGPGWRSRFFANAPWAFHFLPESLRLEVVQRALGPSGGYFIKNKVVGKVPLLLGYNIDGAEVKDGNVRLYLRSQDGSARDVEFEHVIAATGYVVDVEKLKFLSKGIRSQVKTAQGSPVLSSSFESSVPNLYFIGVASANSFGPVMRFAYGASFAARRLTETMEKTLAHGAEPVPVRSVATTAK
ncbi:MAG: NAD(P)/FAD-dependent oxidoreductase [Terriglobales bacterium]|jgi:thioredoxin reductase